MSDLVGEAASCPNCGVRLRLIRNVECVTTMCPKCGVVLVVVIFPKGIQLVTPHKALWQRSWVLVNAQREDLVLSSCSVAGLFAFGAFMLFVNGQILFGVLALVATIVAIIVGVVPVVLDALIGARGWRRSLRSADDILAVEPQGYRR